MVDTFVQNSVDPGSFHCNENDDNRKRQTQRSYSSCRLPSTSNYSNSILNGSSNGSRATSSGLNGSSHHARGTFRNKSFTKPKISATNPVYDPLSSNSNHSTRSSGSFLHSYKKPDLPQKGQYIAMDCEMVGTISGESVAARVVLIDWRGRVVLDSYMKPEAKVADYRTFVSGITEENLKDAPSFADIVKKVQELLQDKILVGHGVDNDLRALGRFSTSMADDARYSLLSTIYEIARNKYKPQFKDEPGWKSYSGVGSTKVKRFSEGEITT
jgi:DNA polymerase III epsilon subunit-like protein